MFRFGSERERSVNSDNQSAQGNFYNPDCDVEEPREFECDASLHLFDKSSPFVENPDYFEAAAMPLNMETFLVK